MKTTLSSVPSLVWWFVSGIVLLKVLIVVLRSAKVKGAFGEWVVSRVLNVRLLAHT